MTVDLIGTSTTGQNITLSTQTPTSTVIIISPIYRMANTKFLFIVSIIPILHLKYR